MSEAERWIMNGRVGVSSKTLWWAMNNDDIPEDSSVGIPHDRDDFERCYNFMKLTIKKEKERIFKNVVEICPEWKGFVREWDNLVDAYEHENNDILYSIIKKLKKEIENEELSPIDALDGAIKSEKEKLDTVKHKIKIIVETIKTSLDAEDYRSSYMNITDLIFYFSRQKYFEQEIRSLIAIKEEIQESEK